MKIKEVLTTILAILCLIYGIIVHQVQSGTSTYLIWLALAILFFALTIFLHLKIWAKLSKTLQRIITIFVTLAIVIFVAVEGCILSGFSATGPDGLDYIIVLGAQVYEDGPSDVLRYRLDTAYDYLIENEDTICIVAGGQGGNEPCPEAEIMYEYLVEKGIDADRILTETESLTTVENLINSSVYLDKENDSVGIVTSNFHIFRGTHLAKALGYQNVYGIAASMDPLYLPSNMAREFFGVAKDVLLGNLI